jgi:hypothetical protein
VRRW